MADAASSLLNWVDALSEEPDPGSRRSMLERHSHADRNAALNVMYEAVLRLSRVDLERAERVVEALGWLADELDMDFARAQALRARGHVTYLRGRHQQALTSYRGAIDLFEALGDDVEVARTINAALQSLAYSGRYEEAMRLAERARSTFELHGDELRLARLDANVANVYYRQDRFHEALELYCKARDFFRQKGSTLDVAITLRNIGVCYISLNQFEEAQATYTASREFCLEHGLPLLAAEADYNIAYMYYLRGEYTKAIALYDATRVFCRRIDDRYHQALCDLDQSEMYLELNLIEEGADLAQRAYNGFRELKMGYEAAKAMAFLAIAASHQGKAQRSIQQFDRSREMFTREANHLWPALIDLYKALVFFGDGDFAASRDHCQAALNFFSESPALSKAVTCELLLARLDLKDGALDAALARCQRATELLRSIESPALVFETNFVLGQIEEARRDYGRALESYERAHKSLERLRSHLHGEGLKIAFLKDKLSVYESIVTLLLGEDASEQHIRSAFDFIERAKSRSLADMIAFRIQALSTHATPGGELSQRLRRLNETAIWARKQATRAELQEEGGTGDRVRLYRRQSAELEGAFARAIDELGGSDRELATLLNAGTVPLEAVQAQIAPDAILLEYYEARQTIYVAIVRRNSVSLVPVGPAAPLREHLRFLQFQLSKFRLGTEYLRTFGPALEAATREHLGELYRNLVAPIRKMLDANHLIVVPHGFLHYLPFHALQQDGDAVIDDFAISYAPSAAVYQLCCVKQAVSGDASLVLGVPDPKAPFILDEAKAVAAVLPNGQLFIGDVATHDVLQQHAPGSKYVHIATHGLFRQDNPMFSSIRLGKSELNIFDLYDLHLGAELVTLSGCGTGLNVVTGGDELLGLVRGLLYAGATGVLVTLWDVNDQSTSDFMKFFYEQIATAPNKAVALQRAMIELRESHPHPYYWAPFLLIGKYQ